MVVTRRAQLTFSSCALRARECVCVCVRVCCVFARVCLGACCLCLGFLYGTCVTPAMYCVHLWEIAFRSFGIAPKFLEFASYYLFQNHDCRVLLLFKAKFPGTITLWTSLIVFCSKKKEFYSGPIEQSLLFHQEYCTQVGVSQSCTHVDKNGPRVWNWSSGLELESGTGVWSTRIRGSQISA